MAKKRKYVKIESNASKFGEKMVEYVPPDSKKRIGIETSPSSYMKKKPTWSFSRIDPELWTIHGDFIERIMPALINFESMTWHEIVSASKSHGVGSQSHAIEISKLIKQAQNRLEELHIYEDSLMSLRITSRERLWGILESGNFNILWYDAKHEICPSTK